ncbi:ribonuclease P/MRP protein subunit RPP1 [Capronia coronata CBS 617.96]|uniref:Ribonuclease P/MRP protein subunit RPP1 n=1 Tax=Capronia coronata CBS 617.96 TaxID=1182541 RepID=W9YEV2_9EURO|nr:ribonuclease P/MRP protein subunit RPP1 [Capronia coronata CBS 617.96]EXJ88205.1 ribonuclease P/MRP protein subunit RPP1 [Capronia coronata CBS 617.96]
MPFHDLNVPYTTNHADLAHTLAFHAELGYSAIALSVAVTGKLPATPPSIPVSSLSVPKSISTVLTRLTLTISDAGQNHRLTSLQPQYSLLALRPTNEKALQLCCNSLDCDLISLDFSQRLPFILKFKTVASALQRGVRFEICYAAGVQGGNSDARRNLISGAAALIRATRGRGIIFSSEARSALGVRAPHDLINLAQVWGLGQERGKEALCEEAGKVVRLAALKRSSFRGVVDVVDGGGAARAKSVQGPKNTSVTEQKGAATRPAGSGGMKDGTAGQKGMDPSHAGPGREETTEQKGPKGVTGGSTARVDVAMSNSNDLKRKASSASIISQATTSATTEPTSDQKGEEKPLSKREMKRRAKKARLEAQVGLDDKGSARGQTTTASVS